MSQSTSYHGVAEPKTSSKRKEGTDSQTFSLQVVSPSVGVPKTLEFHKLPVNTQVKDLKTMIHDSLLSSPPHELQRLIHRGRMLARENETMLEVFGEEMLRNPEFHIIHFVLRPSPEISGTVKSIDMRKSTQAQPASVDTSQPDQVDASPISSLSRPNQTQHHLTSPQNQQHIVLRQVEAIQTLVGQRLQQLQLGPERLNHEIHTIETQGLSRINYIESPPNEHGDQYTRRSSICGPSLTPGNHVQLNTKDQSNQLNVELGCDEHHSNDSIFSSGQASGTKLPSNSFNIQRLYQPPCIGEGEGQNNHRWHIHINETTLNLPAQTSRIGNHISHQLSESTCDLGSSSRYADTSSTSDISRNNEDLSAPIFEEKSLGNKSSIHTRFSLNPAAQVSTSVDINLKSSDSNPVVGSTLPNTTMLGKPLVYILSSPTGPRAILMSCTQNFFTPLQNSGRYHCTFNPGSTGINPATFLDHHNRPLPRRQNQNLRNHNENLPEIGIAAPQANLRAGGVGIQIGQILWLTIRLVGFVWFFTAGNPSWSRWLLASGLALTVFFVLTGILNGVAEQIWNPIRRHFDFLVPLGPLHPHNAPIQPNGIPVPTLDTDEDPPQPRPLQDTTNTVMNETRIGDLNPSEFASRIIDNQSQSDSGWVTRQIRWMRRIEQALIIFVASLVPGVSERHIAHREAQANREVERQQQHLEIATGQDSPENSENPLNRQTESSNEAIIDQPNQPGNLANLEDAN